MQLRVTGRSEVLERGATLETARRERQRILHEIRPLDARDPVDTLRNALRKQRRRNPPGGWPKPFNADVDPDESVN